MGIRNAGARMIYFSERRHAFGDKGGVRCDLEATACVQAGRACSCSSSAQPRALVTVEGQCPC
eukprot:9500886-Pyramimonas_sp.AAC.1